MGCCPTKNKVGVEGYVSVKTQRHNMTSYNAKDRRKREMLINVKNVNKEQKQKHEIVFEDLNCNENNCDTDQGANDELLEEKEEGEEFSNVSDGKSERKETEHDKKKRILISNPNDGQHIPESRRNEKDATVADESTTRNGHQREHDTIMDRNISALGSSTSEVKGQDDLTNNLEFEEGSDLREHDLEVDDPDICSSSNDSCILMVICEIENVNEEYPNEGDINIESLDDELDLYDDNKRSNKLKQVTTTLGQNEGIQSCQYKPASERVMNTPHTIQITSVDIDLSQIYKSMQPLDNFTDLVVTSADFDHSKGSYRSIEYCDDREMSSSSHRSSPERDRNIRPKSSYSVRYKSDQISKMTDSETSDSSCRDDDDLFDIESSQNDHDIVDSDVIVNITSPKAYHTFGLQMESPRQLYRKWESRKARVPKATSGGTQNGIDDRNVPSKRIGGSFSLQQWSRHWPQK